MRAIFVVLILLFSQQARCAEKIPPQASCGDILKDLKLGRSDVSFIECEAFPKGGEDGDGFKATYQVKGPDIANVEHWLIKLAHIEPLRFRCCGWDSPDGDFIGRDGRRYQIGIGGETIVNDRSEFAAIPFLNVFVKYHAP
jgi:hypothetical protein